MTTVIQRQTHRPIDTISTLLNIMIFPMSVSQSVTSHSVTVCFSVMS